jgi:transposase
MTTKQDARKLDALGKEDLRRRVVRAALHEGLSKAEAARVFGVSRTSVHAWLNLYHEHGLDGLTPKRTGRPRGGGQLKGWQAASIVNTIKDKCPDQLKLPFALWTREAVRDLIHIKFGIRYGLGMVGRLLRRESPAPQQPTDHTQTVANAKLDMNQVAHGFACPQREGYPEHQNDHHHRAQRAA